MKNKNILIVTYYWPPSGGSAVQRWLSFANKLSEKSFKVHVLTVDEAYATYQLRDESLKQQINPNIRVHTTKTKEPFKFYTLLFGKNSIPKPAFSNETAPSLLKKISRFIRGNFFIPDPRKGWKSYAVPKALEIIAKENIDTVITAGPPHSTHFIGKELKEKKGICWIADFHDLWTDVIYYDMLYHLPFAQKKDKDLERLILESADMVITVGEKYKTKLLSKSSKLSSSRIKILRIGYEENLFADITSENQSKDFIITYTGSIADFYQPEVFITALKDVISSNPNVSFKLRFVGVLAEGIKNKILEVIQNNVLEDVGYVTQRESLNFLKQSTVLLLITPVTKDEEMVIPGKIYEYLAAHKPIINIAKLKAETAFLIEECKAGETFERNMQDQLKNYLSGLVSDWKSKLHLTVTDNEGCIKKYSRSSITEELINIIHGINK